MQMGSINMYVYLLESIATGWRYIGQTQDLTARLTRHNSGKEKSTKRYAPFRLLGYIEVADRKSAYRLEQSLKALKLREYQFRYFVEHGIMVDDT